MDVYSLYHAKMTTSTRSTNGEAKISYQNCGWEMSMSAVLECIMGLARPTPNNDMHATHRARVQPHTTKYMHMSMDMAPLVKLNMMISMHTDVKCKILLTRRAIVAIVCMSVMRGVPDPLMLAKYTTII